MVVTDPYGSATSRVANLIVGTPPQSLSVAPSSSNSIIVQMSGTPEFPYVLQTATNLVPPVNWQSVLTNFTDANSVWSFTDTNTSPFSAKFYRATIP